MKDGDVIYGGHHSYRRDLAPFRSPVDTNLRFLAFVDWVEDSFAGAGGFRIGLTLCISLGLGSAPIINSSSSESATESMSSDEPPDSSTST